MSDISGHDGCTNRGTVHVRRELRCASAIGIWKIKRAARILTPETRGYQSYVQHDGSWMQPWPIEQLLLTPCRSSGGTCLFSFPVPTRQIEKEPPHQLVLMRYAHMTLCLHRLHTANTRETSSLHEPYWLSNCQSKALVSPSINRLSRSTVQVVSRSTVATSVRPAPS